MSSKAKKKDKLKRKREKAFARAEAEGGGSSPAAASGGRVDDGDSTIAGATVDPFKRPLEEDEMRPISGTGRITSSGTAVQGHEAKFMEELHSGDAILVTHPTT